MLFNLIVLAFLGLSQGIDCIGGETCGSGNAEDCTLTQGFWKTHHPQSWPAGWADATICGTDACSCSITLQDLMMTSSAGGNSFFILGHQYAAALLNTVNGACAPACVNDALASAKTWLLAHCNEEIRDDAANSLASSLDSYNTGSIGPGHCGSPPQQACFDCEFGTCGCSYTQGAWKSKFAQEAANSQGLCQWPRIPAPSCLTWDWLTVSAPTEETLLCGSTWWTILETPVGQSGDLSRNWMNLAHQWIASTLNFMNGACGNCPDQRDACADMWLKLQTAYTQLQTCTSFDWADWESYKNDFDAFNNGNGAVLHCEGNDDPTASACDSASNACPNCQKLSPTQAQNMAQRLYDAGYSAQTQSSASAKFMIW